MAVLSSVLFGLVFLIVGLGSWWNGAQTAQVAAFRAAGVVARSPRGAAGIVAGLNTADQTVRELGGRLAHEPEVVVTGHSVQVTVSVSVGSPAGVFPDEVRRTRSVSFEEFLGEEGR